ncbi:MAG: hypothetical protein ABEJ99_00855 [Candidatus Nanohaloarchaea archaeon]
MPSLKPKIQAHAVDSFIEKEGGYNELYILVYPGHSLNNDL